MLQSSSSHVEGGSHTCLNRGEAYLSDFGSSSRLRKVSRRRICPSSPTRGGVSLTGRYAHLEQMQQFLAHQEHLAPATYNRRLAALNRFCRWLSGQDLFVNDSLGGDAGVETLPRRPEGPHR